MKIIDFLKEFIPPIVVKLLKKTRNNIWSGDFNSWEQASKHSIGYNSSNILHKVEESLLRVKKGEVIYERDSVIFDEIQYSWPLLAGLLKAALDNEGKLSVLDFGGSLGSTYYQNKTFLDGIKGLKWGIVEQEHFVACGKEHFEDMSLQFFYNIEECMNSIKPNVVLLSSVLQYLDKPYDWINKIIALRVPYIIIDRTAFTKSDRDILTIQNVAESIYKASYPAWFFSPNLINAFQHEYEIVQRFDNGFTPPTKLKGGQSVFWNGIIFKLKK